MLYFPSNLSIQGSEETGPDTGQIAELQTLEDEKAQDKGNYYVIIKDLVMITLNFNYRRIRIVTNYTVINYQYLDKLIPSYSIF